MPDAVVGVTTEATVAAGHVNAHVRVAAVPGVGVSVQASEAVAAAAARVQLRPIVPAEVAVLKVLGVTVGAPKAAAPAPEIAHAVTVVLPVPTAPEAAIAMLAVAAPAAPAGKVTPAAVVGV